MATQNQIEANRRNAQKSTGPRTPEGRAAVRLNGVKHGLSAETLVLRGESESDFHTLFDSLESEYRPATPTEELLVSQLAMATWRLRRLYHMEAAFFDLRYLDLKDHTQDLYSNLKPSDRQAVIFDKDCEGPHTLANLSRHEARLERSMYRALHEIQRVQAQRLKSETLPAAAPAPEKEIAKQTQSAAPPQRISHLRAATPTAPEPVMPARSISPTGVLG